MPPYWVSMPCSSLTVTLSKCIVLNLIVIGLEMSKLLLRFFSFQTNIVVYTFKTTNHSFNLKHN